MDTGQCVKVRLDAVNGCLPALSVLIQCIVALIVSVIWTTNWNSLIFYFSTLYSDIVMKSPMFLAITEMNFPANVLFDSWK
jgi:hypothetical protein